MVNTIDELVQLVENDEENQYIAVRQPIVSTSNEHELVFDSEGFVELPDGSKLIVNKAPPTPTDDIQKFYNTTIKPKEIPIDVAQCYADKNQDEARNIQHAFNKNFDPQDRWSAAGRGIKVVAPFANGEWYKVTGFYVLPYKSSSRGYNFESFGQKMGTVEASYLWQYKEYTTPKLTNKWLCTFNGNTNEGKNWNSFPAIIPVGEKLDVIPVCPIGQFWDIVSQQCIGDTTENRAPISNAGFDQIVSTGMKVVLDGRGSSDPDGDLLSYIWTLKGGLTPNITEFFKIANFEGAIMEFIAPAEPTEMLWELKVTDPEGLFSTDEVKVTVTKNPPTKVDAVITHTTDTDCSTTTDKSLETMAKHKPDISIHSGDLSHVDSSAQCYYTISEKHGIFPIEKVTNGNHDGQEDGSSGIEAEIRAKYGFPTQQEIDGVMYQTDGYYRVLRTDIKSYFLCLFTQDSQMSRRDSNQYKFAEACLKEAVTYRERGSIKWIFVWFHKPIYTKGTRHAPLRDVRAIYQPLFDQYGVDVVNSGHVHVGEVTKPIKYGGQLDANPIITDKKTPTGAWDFAQADHGQIYVTASSGGRGIDGANSNQDEWSLYTNDQEFLIFVYVLSHNFSKLTIIAQPNDDITVNKFITTVEKGEIIIEPLQANAGGDQSAVAIGQRITLDGRASTGFPLTWKWEITKNDGNHAIVIDEANTSTPKLTILGDTWKQVKENVEITLTVTDRNGLTSTDTMLIIDNVEDVPIVGYPLPITELYNSDRTLSQDIVLPQDKTHPSDPVLLSSGASGVDSHSIVNGALEIETGGGNGRVYWNHHEIANSDAMRYNNFFYSEFKMPAGVENYSLKDGNHGTDGWVFDGRFIFGGFGFSLHRREIQSKLEWYHNVQGNEVAQTYPGGREINTTDWHSVFAAFRTDANKGDVVLDVWMKFANETSWVQVLSNRRWGNSGDYNVPSLPSGEDTEAIKKGAIFIPRNHIWTRNNGSGSAKLPIRKIRMGTLTPIS